MHAIAMYEGCVVMSTRLRLLGSTRVQEEHYPYQRYEQFVTSDSRLVSRRSSWVRYFQLKVDVTTQDRVQCSGIRKGWLMACKAPSFFKADGAEYAENSSGAKRIAESISGVAEVYLA